MGCFYYENGVLEGLSDDIANDSLKGSDGILKINNYLTSNTAFNLKYEYNKITTWYPHNYLIALNLVYSTPCDTFTVSLQDKYKICKGDSIQMQLSGGATAPLSGPTYEWEPQVGMSCYNCAQPYFTDTVSRWYTVRVRNNDSCSKVLPVRIEVLENPPNPIVAVQPTKCSDSSGVATVQMVNSSYVYSLNNGVSQTGAVFNNLFAGLQTVSAIDTNGCKASTAFNILETFPNADFTATPQQGDVPLEVSFVNQSSGATDFVWYIEQDTSYNTNATHTFQTDGVFDVTLVAYDTYPHCADTAQVNIFAEYPFTIFAPTIHSIKQGNYQIYTSAVQSLSYTLYNAIGQIIYTKELDVSQGYQSLWSANTMASGTYIYKIIATGDNGEQKVVSGKVVVI